ncbi:hypothetical protein Ddye_021745 [Dipteronia dyeriana]|uniref:Uncharacterized protein n=1 Tax=Dipteronia dyeriana TaxID=168575 RepID=A0AAD9U288_9ROSI|nr:hypothetical protein Ddye_021745 [Dipteronia dyeriana]
MPSTCSTSTLICYQRKSELQADVSFKGGDRHCDANGRVMACNSQLCDANFDMVTAKAMAVCKGIAFSRDCGFKELGNVVFKCVSKVANRAARTLANEAMGTLEDGFWMEEAPSCISSLVIDEQLN